MPLRIEHMANNEWLDSELEAFAKLVLENEKRPFEGQEKLLFQRKQGRYVAHAEEIAKEVELLRLKEQRDKIA